MISLVSAHSQNISHYPVIGGTLAIKIAEREKIPVIATNMDLAKIKDVLNKI